MGDGDDSGGATRKLIGRFAEKGYEQDSYQRLGALRGSRWLTAQPSDGSIPIQDQLTFPGPPSGFTQSSLYAFPNLFTTQPSDTVSTFDITLGYPFEIDVPTWTAIFNTIQQQLPGVSGGWDLLAYEIDSQPGQTINIPSQICVAGFPCITLPNQVCIPFTDICTPLGGSQVVIGANYRIWGLVAEQVQQQNRSVRGQIIWTPWFILTLLAAFVVIYSLLTHQTTFGQVTGEINTVLHTPGQNVADAATSVEYPLIALGGLALLLGVGIPALQLGGNVNAPGGAGFGGNIGIGNLPSPPPRGKK